MTPRPRKNADRIRAIAYVRVSSERQADSGLSLEHQQDKCRALATLHDYELIDVVVDAGESAASLDRPGMARVLDLVNARQVEAVLVAKLDRCTRSVRDLSDLLDRFARRHVALVSASESLNTETAAGRMVVRMLAVVAEWEREAIGERTADALRAKRQRGERYGALPYGARLSPDGKRLDVDHAEREMIGYACELRDSGLPWREVAERLNANGYRNRRGAAWKLTNVRAAVLTRKRLAEHSL